MTVISDRGTLTKQAGSPALKGHEPNSDGACMRNTSQVGEASVAHIMAALAAPGRQILLPFGDSKRYDLVIEEEDGRFFRIQCKTGRVHRGSLRFPTCSHTNVRPGTPARGYRGQVDFFGVYCPAVKKVYLVPVNDVPVGEACLRLTAPENNQRSGIRWARDYELGGVAQLGARVNGIHEVRGSNPLASTCSSVGELF